MQINSYFEVERDGKHTEDHRVSGFSRDNVLQIFETILLLPLFFSRNSKRYRLKVKLDVVFVFRSRHDAKVKRDYFFVITFLKDFYN